GRRARPLALGRERARREVRRDRRDARRGAAELRARARRVPAVLRRLQPRAAPRGGRSGGGRPGDLDRRDSRPGHRGAKPAGRGERRAAAPDRDLLAGRAAAVRPRGAPGAPGARGAGGRMSVPERLLSQLAHVELVTPKLEESRWFFGEVLGLEDSGRDAESVYFRGWGERFHHSLRLT